MFWGERNRLFEETLGKVEKWLAAEGYVGSIDLNCIVNESGMPLAVTGKGETMQQAREQYYDRIDSIRIPNLYYRDDIGERWIDGDGDRLLSWEYLGA